MGAALLTVMRWAELSGAERVEVYTRWSLYVVLGALNLLVLVGAGLEDDLDGATLAVAGGCLVMTVLGLATMEATVQGRAPVRRVVPLLVAGAAWYAVAVIAFDDDTVRGVAVMTTLASILLPLGLLPGRRVAGGLVVLSMAAFGISGGEAVNAASGLIFAVSLLFTGRASMWILGVVSELDAARQAQSQLAVMEERLRFSRDVHDVLGRRLSTIAVQAELAATLAERGDERSAERMLEVRAVAHEALREARELARGYRVTDFLAELEGARSLLRSAGIEVELHVDAMPRAWHEAAAWVVRESATNILRHSRASRVEIVFAGEQLRVGNDGARPGDAGDGTGLRGLRERLAPLGASLDARPDGDDRWSVVATLPGAGPLSAATP